MADVSEVLTASIIRATPYPAQTTLRNIVEDSHLQTRRRENLKSHLTLTDFILVLSPYLLFILPCFIFFSLYLFHFFLEL
jgi:hypothetical protein